MNGSLISNTGPIIALMLIERINILQNLFQKVVDVKPYVKRKDAPNDG